MSDEVAATRMAQTDANEDDNEYNYDEPDQAEEEEPLHEQMVGNFTEAELNHQYRSDPIAGFGSRDQIRLQPKRLMELILTYEVTMKIAPTLLIVSGLPKSQKTTAVQHMLEDIHSQSFENEVCSQKKQGVGFYEILAARNPIKHKKKIIFSPSDVNKGYPSVIYSGIERIIRLTGHTLKEVLYRLSFSEFANSELNKHLSSILKDMHELNLQKNIKQLEWDQCHPNGLALINIWDIGLSKVAAYLLPRLSDYLHNCHVWMFLDLLRDIDNLHKAPEIPYDKERNDRKLIMKWRSRIRYLLRFAKLASAPAKSHCKKSRVIASLTESDQDDTVVTAMIEKLSKQVQSVSEKMKVAHLIDTEDVRLFNSFRKETNGICKKLLEKIIHDGLNNPVDVPLSFVLLRSMFYKRDNLYISKEKLREISAELIPSSQSFDEFCHLFTSFGSIIDMSLIDPTNNTIILKPVQFLNELETLFYYKGDDPLVTQYGLVTEETANNIFKQDKHVFMSFLKSLNFAIEVPPTQCNIPFTGSFIYYVPNVCTVPPDLQCSPTALHFIHDVNVPLSYFKVVFSSIFLQVYCTARLEMSPTHSKINVTRFRSNDVVFELVYFGDSIEFRLQHLNEEVCTQIIQTCKRIMQTNDCQYNFAVMCAHENDKSACGLGSRRHLLPIENPCSLCSKTLPDDNSVWNIVLKENKVPEKRILNGKMERITAEDALTISEKLLNLSPRGEEIVVNQFGIDASNLKVKKKRDWKFYMKIIIEWMEHDDSTEQSKLQLCDVFEKAIKDLDPTIINPDQEILESLVEHYGSFKRFDSSKTQ